MPASPRGGLDTVGFAVDVPDDDDGATDVKRVFALYLDADRQLGRAPEFSHNGNRWSGAGPVSGNTLSSGSSRPVDGSGQCRRDQQQGERRVTRAAAHDRETSLRATLTGTLVNGWYTGAVGVTITAGSGVGITYSLDGSPFPRLHRTPLQRDGRPPAGLPGK